MRIKSQTVFKTKYLRRKINTAKPNSYGFELLGDILSKVIEV